MQRLEVSGAVRPIYGSLGIKWLREKSCKNLYLVGKPLGRHSYKYENNIQLKIKAIFYKTVYYCNNYTGIHNMFRPKTFRPSY